MKSFRVWEQLTAPLNVWEAWREFARGKWRRPAVATFALHAERHVLRLAEELARGTYRPGPYRLLRVQEPKRRLVAAAPVRDRVVHHAVHRVLSPLYDASFIEPSFACLPGRGSHRAVLRFLRQQRRWRYVLHLDIQRYFYSIDRQRLGALLSCRLREPQARLLLQRILDSGEGLYQDVELAAWLGWDEVGKPGLGLPIGNLTSQWWGNLYLNGADHLATRTLKVSGYQRYMDDLTLFGDDPGALRAARDDLARWLAQERGLALKEPDAKPSRCDRAQRYLGYKLTRRGVQIGPTVRQRVWALVSKHKAAPAALEHALTSLRGCWMFGALTRQAPQARARRAEQPHGGTPNHAPDSDPGDARGQPSDEAAWVEHQSPDHEPRRVDGGCQRNDKLVSALTTASPI
jgi:RNA-directed DNA polymerase